MNKLKIFSWKVLFCKTLSIPFRHEIIILTNAVKKGYKSEPHVRLLRSSKDTYFSTMGMGSERD